MGLLLENVKKSYREPGGGVLPVLDIDRFEVASGEQVVLVGESGGGKTTLLNVISGITSPDSGRVVIDGIDIASLHEVGRDRFRAAKIGFVFQTFNLLPAFTALENVILGAKFSSRPISKADAKKLLERVDLGDRLNHKPSKLSVGQQQRVAVARAMANQPVLLLADEPTANIDPANQESVLRLIRDSCAEHNIALLLVTHSTEISQQFSRVEKLNDFNRAGAAV